MTQSRNLGAATLALALLFVTPASAHVGVSPAATFSHGFLHPMNGLDHVLAMVAVGLYAASLAGAAAIWLVPAAFVVTMIAGGAIGYFGWSLPLVEQAIALSVVVLGLAIAVGVRLPMIAAMTLVGVFALFHGHAHGSEGAGQGLSFAPYTAGFVLATAGLHAVGVAIGLSLDRNRSKAAEFFKRSAGALGALAGLSLMAGWLSA